MKISELHSSEPIAEELHLKVLSERYESPDQFCKAHNFTEIGDGWRKLSKIEAHKVLFALLIRDMAYKSPRLSKEQTKEVIDEFFSSFSVSALYFTNGNWEEGTTSSKDGRISYGPSWTPLTQATFDGGVLVLDEHKSGIIWLEDED